MHHLLIGLADNHKALLLIKLSTYNENLQSHEPLPIPGGGCSGAIPVLTAMGTLFPEGVTVVPLSSHMEILSSRTASAMESRLFPTLLRELFHLPDHTVGKLTLWTLLADQTTTVHLIIVFLLIMYFAATWHVVQNIIR